MRWGRARNEENTIDEIDFMVTKNMENLKNSSENENMDVYDNEVEDEASSMPTNQESLF